MLGNLFGKRKTVKRESTQVWKTRAQAFEGMLAFCRALDPTTQRALVVTQFADTFHDLHDLCLSHGTPVKTYPTAFEGHRLRDPYEYQAAGGILLVPAHALPDAPSASAIQAAACDFQINLLVAEHHPLPAYDDRILEFAASLPGPCRVIFHDALNGALLQHYGGDQIAQIMAALKMPENECVASGLVDKSIRKAQEKIARRVTNPMTADSAEQWFQLHLADR